jgi:hypothetical protein
MLIDAMRTWISERYLPWIVLLFAVLWIGWKTNDVAAIIEKHYSESRQLIKVTEQICKAVSKTANLDSHECEEIK